MSITDAGRQLAEEVAAEFAQRIPTFASGLGESDRQVLSRLAAHIVAADAHRHGIDLRTATG